MKRVVALLMFALAANGCDDALVQDAPGDAGNAQVDTGDASATRAIDGGIDATIIDAGFVDEPDAASDARDASALPYAREVVSFREGSNAGYGREALPGVVLGPPSGKGTGAGALDVLSLGVGGEIVLDFGLTRITDGAGADFIVFENAFWAGGANQAAVFAELGEVAVSNDLTNWLTFPCSLTPSSPGVYPGCAGWTPTQVYDPFQVVPLDPARTGGDAFDLATLAIGSVRYVRVRDLATSGQGDSAGFDLDAIGIINAGVNP